MTSEAGVNRVVEEQFSFHCSCGVSFETSSTKVICNACGETIEVVRCIPTAAGKKYKLRISRQRRDWNGEPGIWPPVFAMGVATSAHHPHHEFTTHSKRHPEVLDYSERCLRLGLLILLAPLWVPLLLWLLSAAFAPAPIEPRQGLIAEPKPSDCGLFSGCHYEQRTRVEKGYTIVNWERVNN